MVNVKENDIQKDFLDERGEGLHHILFMVNNLEKTLDKFKAKGIDVLQEDRFVGGGGLAYMDIFGLVNLVEAGLEHLETAAAENGDAAITAIGSTAATAAANPSAYGAIKGAMAHYIKGVAKVNAAKKIRANVVSPGMVYFEGGVWSRIEQNQPDVFKASLARNPTGRMATPQEIANAVVFISSPCSTFTSGINMIVDGAMTDRVNY